jgi:putative endonuclease
MFSTLTSLEMRVKVVNEMGEASHGYWVYIVASGPYGWLYVGMTNDLVRRIGEHRHGQIDGYSRERGTDRLVWYEQHQYVDQAILREKRIKRWLRPWKFTLIEESNPAGLTCTATCWRRRSVPRLSPDGCPGAGGRRLVRPGSPLRCGRDDKGVFSLSGLRV